jgi:nicotinamide-nucleotide amidase
VRVELLTVGTELLLGQIVDTNGAELGRALAAAGAEVTRRTSVADRADAIRDAVARALERTECVIVTGGLGPTSDDVTKRTVAGLLGRPLVRDAAVVAVLEERFRRLGRPMPAANLGQADVPAGAVVLPNPRGTAPGLWVEDERGRLVVLLPGVPSEMRGLLVEEVLPRLAARPGGTGRVIRSLLLRTTGVPESAVAERIAPLEAGLAPLTLAYLPSTDGVDLRLTAWDLEPADADARLAAAGRRLGDALGADWYGGDGTDLAAVVLDRLRARGYRLAVAESCTGGLVGARITAVPGASDTFIGGVVAYADDVKADLLDVPRATLAAHGAVSEEAVSAMALGAQRRFGVECAIAVTGIAGPAGGTPDKPVGTVWLAAAVRDETRALRRRFPGDREEIRRRGAQAALDLLRRLLG